MTAATRAALETKVTSSAIHQFGALISCQSPFAPVAGLTIENCLDGGSNLLAIVCTTKVAAEDLISLLDKLEVPA